MELDETMTINPETPSSFKSSKTFDLNARQLRETIDMLTLTVSQVERTMTLGENSVTALSQSFIDIANQLKQLTVEKNNEFNEINNLDTQNQKIDDIHKQVMTTITAFQFYDRISLRLDHLKSDLSWLSNIVSDPNQISNPSSWSKLQEDIMSNYTMEEERIMFQHILKGSSVEEALEIYSHHFKSAIDESDSNSDEIALF